MGAKASKTATVAERSAGAATAAARSAGNSSLQARGKQPQNIDITGQPITSASYSKSEEILRDASDPSGSHLGSQLSRNLASLGQARIIQAQASHPGRFVKVSNTDSTDRIVVMTS